MNALKVAFLLVFAMAASAIQVAAIQGDASFKIERGQYLWHVWNSPAVKQKYPNWQEYWREVARMNNLLATERVWRSMPAGRVIVIPAVGREVAQGDVTTDTVVARLRQDSASLVSRARELEERVTTLDSQLALVSSESRNTNWLVVFAIILGVLAILLFALLTRTGRRLAEAREELERAHEDARAKAPAVEFAKSQGVRFELPPDIVKVSGTGSAIYFSRDPFRLDEGTVIIPGIEDPVKIENIKKRLDRAHPEVLEYNGLRKVGESTDETEPVYVRE